MSIRKLVLISLFCFIATFAHAEDYWVYVRLEDRSGVTAKDDVGMSKAGDVIQILPCSKYSAETRHKTEWLIFKADLTEEQKREMLEPDVEIIDEIEVKKAYRKYKLDTKSLGITVKKGLVVDKIDKSKIKYSEKTSADFARYATKRRWYLAIQRPWNIIDNKIIPWAFAESVSLINTGEAEDSTHYDTLTGWEDAKNGDLVTATSQETASCYDDDGDLSDNPVIDGSTTNSLYYMKITSPEAERHDGTSGSGFHLISADTSNNGINLADDYAVVEWLEISGWTGYSGWNTRYGVVMGNDQNQILRNCIIHDSGNDARNVQHGISQNRGNEVSNNFIYNISGIGIHNSLGYADNNNIINNTVYNYNTRTNGTQKGIQISTDSEGVIKNNIVIAGTNGGDCFSGFQDMTHDYNASSDATADGANSLNSGTASVPSTSDFESITGSSEDLHLASGAVEIDEGEDLGATYAIDINGRDRDSEGDTWDMGADELVSASPSTDASTSGSRIFRNVILRDVKP